MTDVKLGEARAVMAQIEAENTVKTPEPPKDGLLTAIWGARNHKAQRLAERRDFELNTSIEARFASEVARRYSGRPMAEITKILPEAWREGAMPKDPNEAFMVVAAAAHKVASRHMDGPAHGLSPEHSREAREMGLVAALVFDQHKNPLPFQTPKPISAVLEKDAVHHAQAMRLQLNPEIAPKQMRPGPQNAEEVAMAPKPVMGAVIAARAHAAGRGM